MYICVNCGGYVDELFREYSPSVLKLMKCESCGNIADKYIEYDPVVVLVDIVLLEKPAFRHFLYNSNFNSYWKLLIVLILGESFQKWTSYKKKIENLSSKSAPPLFLNSFDHLQQQEKYKFEMKQVVSITFFQGEKDFYLLLVHMVIAMAVFIFAILATTELRWFVFGGRSRSYKTCYLVQGLVIGSCTKLLALLGIIWQHTGPELNNALICGYTILCLLTTYSVCKSGRISSFIGLAGGFWAYHCVRKFLGH